MPSKTPLPVRRVVIIQARMGSSRLPGKVMMPLADKPVLEHVVTRVMAAKQVDAVVVATSTEPANDAIAQMCANHGWTCVRGSETDVLSRYAKATRAANADVVVRVTSDCPLFSPLILDGMLYDFMASEADYLSTNLPTRSFPVGLDCEVMRADCLLLAADKATAPYDREHVTPYLYHNPDQFRLRGYACDQALEDIRITLDTAEDYAVLQRLVDAHPELADPQQDVIDVVSQAFGRTKVKT